MEIHNTIIARSMLAAALCVGLSSPVMAGPSINDMQTCQALLEFLDQKLERAPKSYGAEQVNTVRAGLSGYHQYIQQDIVTPGLLAFTKGDRGKAGQMQQQVDAYKAQLVGSLNKRYPQPQLFMDHAISVNECAKKAVPSGVGLEALKTALETMVELSKQS